MLWMKALHVVFMVAWFAGLFYLPRLFVYHAMASDPVGIERFKVMERKLFWGIMTPSGVVTTILGLVMLHGYAWGAYKNSGWLHAKLLLVVFLLAYHGFCYKLLKDFKHDRNTRSHTWYRVYNELPTLLLLGIVILVIVKPF